jgi:hypothetical protein
MSKIALHHGYNMALIIFVSSIVIAFMSFFYAWYLLNLIYIP